MSAANLAKIVVFISGRGSNLQALINAAPGRYQIAGVICNQPAALGVKVAQAAGILVRVIEHSKFAARSDFDAELMHAAQDFAADYIVLAGFMRRLGSEFVRAWAGRIINIHPSLLPKYSWFEHACARA